MSETVFEQPLPRQTVQEKVKEKAEEVRTQAEHLKEFFTLQQILQFIDTNKRTIATGALGALALGLGREAFPQELHGPLVDAVTTTLGAQSGVSLRVGSESGVKREEQEKTAYREQFKAHGYKDPVELVPLIEGKYVPPSLAYDWLHNNIEKKYIGDPRVGLIESIYQAKLKQYLAYPERLDTLGINTQKPREVRDTAIGHAIKDYNTAYTLYSSPKAQLERSVKAVSRTSKDVAIGVLAAHMAKKGLDIAGVKPEVLGAFGPFDDQAATTTVGLAIKGAQKLRQQIKLPQKTK